MSTTKLKGSASELVGYNRDTGEFYSIQPGDKPPSDITRKTTTQRCLQTMAVLWHVITIYPLIPGCLILLYAIHHPIRVASAILLSLILPRSLSSRSQFLRSLPIWNAFASYFPMQLYRSAPLPATRKYIFGYHPHGVLSHGVFAAFATEALGFAELFPGIENALLTLDSNFKIPLYRDYLLTLGLDSVSRGSCERLLTHGGVDGKGTGQAITIVIGGARESLEAVPNTMALVLRNRKGFVRLAIRTGADLVPVLAFGENDLYERGELDSNSFKWKVQMVLKNVLGFTVPFLYTRGALWFDMGMTPRRRPVNIVVGRPIPTGQVLDTTSIDDAYVDELHRRYIEEVQRMWNEWRDTFASHREQELRIL